MSVEWKLSLLLLDDQPDENCSEFGRLLEELGAKLVSGDDLAPLGRRYLLKGWEFGEDIEISLKTLGGNRDKMLAHIADEDFISRFDAAFVDLGWGKLTPTFAPSHFGGFALDFRGVEQAGLPLARLLKSKAPDIITVMVSQNRPQLPDIKWAIQHSGAFQFIEKSEIVELFNVFVYCMERVRQRQIAERTRQVANGAPVSRLRNAIARSGFDAYSVDLKLLSSLPEPAQGLKSIKTSSEQSGLSIDAARAKIPMLKKLVARHGLLLEVEGENWSTREI